MRGNVRNGGVRTLRNKGRRQRRGLWKEKNMAPTTDWKVSLLIDDEEDIRDVVGVTLMDAGYEVDSAGDGEAGLKKCAEVSPQIVITDVRMPGISGIEVLETVKKRFPHMEVIVATAFGDMDLAVRALQLNASDFITKPINVEALLVALDRAKHRYSTAEQIREYTRFVENGWTETTKELLETFAYQRSLIESSMDGILGCDSDGLVVTFNRSMENMLGYKESETVRKLTFDSLIEPEDGQGVQKGFGDSRIRRKRPSVSLRNVAEKQRGKKDTCPGFRQRAGAGRPAGRSGMLLSGTCGKYTVWSAKRPTRRAFFTRTR